MVACNETTNLVRAGGHLVDDLHVPAIVGPASDQNALDLSNNLTIAAGTVLLTPTASAASIAELADNDLTWLMVPSDMQRGKLLTNQINQLETELRAIRGKPTIRLAIAYRNDAVGFGTLRSLSDLVINGKPLNDPINAGSPGGNVTIDGYELSAPNQDALVSRYVSFAPDIIVLAGLAEGITTVMNPIEQRWSDAGVQRPYYVLTEQLKGPDLITSVTSLPTLRPRVRGTGVISTGSSVAVKAAFEVDYRARYGVTPAARGAGQAFDAAYAIAYALAATRDQSVSGASIASGLRKLAGGATTVNVGAADITTAMAQLGAGKSITAIGTFAGLAWEAGGAVAGGTLEVWCIGSSAVTPVYESSGLGYDVAAGTFFGTYVQCSP
jgi:branched-chain amino acid transport system substrate-binding protein